MRIIAVMSPKGGIGKTTTSDSIAYMLGEEQGKRVLHYHQAQHRHQYRNHCQMERITSSCMSCLSFPSFHFVSSFSSFVHVCKTCLHTQRARQQEKSRSVADGNRKRRLQRPPNRTRKQQARAFLIDWRCSR